MRETIKYGFTLGLICMLSSGLLAVVNGLTGEKIILEKENETIRGLKEVMPNAQNFKPRIKDEKVNYYLAVDSADKLIGFVLMSEEKGYSSDIEVLTALNLDLEITAVKIISQNETPGLGNRITEPQFIGQFTGKNLDTFTQVQAITGATISSGAVINSIKNKILGLKEQLIKEAKDAG